MKKHIVAISRQEVNRRFLLGLWLAMHNPDNVYSDVIDEFIVNGTRTKADRVNEEGIFFKHEDGEEFVQCYKTDHWERYQSYNFGGEHLRIFKINEKYCVVEVINNNKILAIESDLDIALDKMYSISGRQ